MDAFQLVHSDRELQNEHLDACVNFFRQHPVYWSSSLVFVPENAPGSRGGEIAYLMRNVPACMTMEEFGQDKRPGVPKDHPRTQKMVVMMRKLLSEDAIHLSSDFATFPGKQCTEQQVGAILDQLFNELLAFKFVQGAASGRGKYTGKGGTSGRDDLAVAVLMGPLWESVFTKSETYTKFKREAYQRVFSVK